MGYILEIRDLTKFYPDGTKALNGISLSIEKGELISIIGSSGAGKSTLLRCINHLVPSTSGNIFFNGKHEVTKAKGYELREIRRKIGMAFQSFNLIKRSQTIKNVLRGRLGYMSSIKGGLSWFFKEDTQRALELFARVGVARALAPNRNTYYELPGNCCNLSLKL